MRTRLREPGERSWYDKPVGAAIISCLFLMYTSLLIASSCVPKPTTEECFKKTDCLSCTVAYCGWCGARPGVKATGKGCYAMDLKPLDCEPPPHFDFCYQDSFTPINNRMYLKRPDGGVDGGQK